MANTDPTTIEKHVKDFSGLLEDIESLDDKVRALWVEIYENAITDRINAHMLFTELHDLVQSDPTQHAIHGPQLARYIERMSRSTDQLMKLAEMISAAQRASENLNQDEIFGKAKALR